MYRSIILFLFLVVLITSCGDDPITNGVSESTEVNANIPVTLNPYFITFKEKAAEHNIIVDYEAANVTAEIQLINKDSVAGTCSTNGHNHRHIVIDQSFWNSASHLMREMVVFHELGHCVLGRGHREDSFSNGICRSIMRSGLGDCRDAYISENRDYFITELFTVGN